jgi:hypothetical protein
MRLHIFDGPFKFHRVGRAGNPQRVVGNVAPPFPVESVSRWQDVRPDRLSRMVALRRLLHYTGRSAAPLPEQPDLSSIAIVGSGESAMPKSKHRRNPGGKSVRRSGYTAPERGPSEAAIEAAAFDIMTLMSVMVDNEGAGGSLRQKMLSFRVHRDVLFKLFLRPGARCDKFARTAATAEAALALLLERETFVIDGDMVSISPRIAEAAGAVSMMGGDGLTPAPLREQPCFADPDT